MVDTSYKYLGTLQNRKMKYKKVKRTLTKEFESCIRSLLKSKLNSRNLAINKYVNSALQFSYGVVEWTQTHLDGINRKILTELAKSRMHHLEK